MGILSALLGGTNPAAQWANQNHGFLSAVGSGLGSGQNFSAGLATAAQNGPSGSQLDYARQLQQNALDLQTQQRNQTADWAEKNGHKDWADLLRSGAVTGSDVFNLLNKQTVVPFGSSVVNGEGQTVSGGSSGQYGGTGMDSQNWNLVLKAQSDKTGQAWNDPQVQAAWAQLNQPTVTYQQTPQGLVAVSKPPNLPPGWGPPAPGQSPVPTGALPSGAAPAMAPSGTQPAPSGTLANVGGITTSAPLPGTKPAPNESQNRIDILAKMAVPDLKNAVADFSSLRDPLGQLLSRDPTGLTNALKSPSFQRAQTAVRASISNILYTVSGAAVGDKELERKIQDLTPQFGEDVTVSAQKLDRLSSYIDAIAGASGDPKTVQAAQEAEAGIADAKAQMLNGGKPPVSGKTSSGLAWSLN